MPQPNKFIPSWPALIRRLRLHRRRKQSIVFTNGVFDLLHAGHLKVFSYCRKQGDIVVVGLNSDRSTKKIKGPKRPIVDERGRAAVLSGLADVDYVTLFHERTPENLIERIRPDVLVKGGDYKKPAIVGGRYVKKVVRVPFAAGRSSTDIIGRILRRYGH